MKNYFSFFIFIILFLGCTQNTPGWKKGEVVKSEKLIAIIGNGQSGFTEMNPTQTGITAANQISEKEVLGNQHLKMPLPPPVLRAKIVILPDLFSLM